MKHLVAHLCGIATLLLLLGHSAPAAAQTYRQPVRLPVDIYEGDTIPVVHLPNVYIYRPPQFGSRRQERFYWRNVRDVKKTLPIAREVRGIIIETYEYLLTIPDEKARQAHLDTRHEAVVSMVEAHPHLAPFYRADDPDVEVFYLAKAQATIFSSTPEPLTIAW